MRSLVSLFSSVLFALLLLLLPTEAKEQSLGPVEVVASFNAAALETPEDIYIDWEGNRYVNLLLTGEVRKIAPNGAQSTFALLPIGPVMGICYPMLPVPFPALLGIDQDLLGNFYFSIKACDPAKSGVWRTNRDGGNLTLIGVLPPESVGNGISVHGGFVYVADAFQPYVWRVPAWGGTAVIWSDDPLLQVRPEPMWPGPNGLKVFRGEVYVSVSDTARIVAIPIQRNGTAGPARLHATIGPAGGPGCDNFSFDIQGNLYCGTDPFNTVLKITPTGQVTTLLTAADGLDGPTATFFGRGLDDSTKLYISNASFPFFPTSRGLPSLLRVDVGVPGALFQ